MLQGVIADDHAASSLHQIVQVALEDLQHALHHQNAEAVRDQAELAQARKVDIIVVPVGFLLVQVGLQLYTQLARQLPARQWMVGHTNTKQT